MNEKSKRGGAGRGQGRKSLSPFSDSQTIQARVTEEQAKKYKNLGGAVWLRKKIDEA